MYTKPNTYTFVAGGTILKGNAVKLDTDNQELVVECTGATDKSIGIAQEDAATGKQVEVALAGGGAVAKVNGSAAVLEGQLMVPHTDGTLKKVAAANDRFIAVAMKDGATGDLIPVQVLIGQATATES